MSSCGRWFGMKIELGKLAPTPPTPLSGCGATAHVRHPVPFREALWPNWPNAPATHPRAAHRPTEAARSPFPHEPHERDAILDHRDRDLHRDLEHDRNRDPDRESADPPSVAAPLPPPLAIAARPDTAPIDAPAAAAVRARSSLEELLPLLVRRIAWSGDARRGTVRLELGAGALAGATLVIHSDDDRVRVHLSAPPGADLEAWTDRIARRLAARGIDVDEVRVE